MKLGVAWQLLRAARLLVADPEDQLVQKVQSVLDDSLRRPKYKGHENLMTGQCYVASEALFYLLGGKAAGWTPMFISHEGEPHWFLRNADGHILDATASQFKTPVPYEKARGKGFLTLKPSKRAQAVIDRVDGLDKRAARLLLAATYPTFFLRSFQEAARAHQDTLVESLVNLCDLDPEEFEPEAFVAKGYEEVRHRLPESMDVVLGPVMRSGLETAVGGALEARARLLGMSQAVETSIDYFEVKFQGQKLRMTFQLLCGDADITNEDEKANAPDADRLVRESLGAGATVNLESIEKVETGGTEAFFVFEVFYERTLDLQELVENTLGAKVRAALAKIAVQETT